MRRLIVGAIICLVLLSVGCVKSLPIDRCSYVMDIGVEKGERLPYLVTLMLNSPAGSSEGGSEGSVSLVSAEGRSLFEAIETLSAGLPNQLNFTRTTLLAFSAELAEAGEIPEIMDIALSKLRIRENARVMIMEGGVKAALEGAVSESDPTTGSLKINLENMESLLGTTVDTKWNELKEAFDSDTHDALVGFCALNEGEPKTDMVGSNEYSYLGGGLLIEGELKTAIMGSAVFSKGRMVGVLDGQNTMLVRMAAGGFVQGRIRLNTPDGRELSVSLYQGAEPEISLSGGVARFTIALEADVEMPKILQDFEPELLETLISEDIAKRMALVFKRTQEAGADVFGLGKSAIKGFERTADWESYDFPKQFYGFLAEFFVTVKLNHSPDNNSME
ncbi:MAG: Ger(x)C family spore germination C-terminal domain-containing protein [Clostridia bacterium]|nr:Ger(x)C family spore germination C-terminal domain-containing protein [Clostridia bacterium]